MQPGETKGKGSFLDKKKTQTRLPGNHLDADPAQLQPGSPPVAALGSESRRRTEKEGRGGEEGGKKEALSRPPSCEKSLLAEWSRDQLKCRRSRAEPVCSAPGRSAHAALPRAASTRFPPPQALAPQGDPRLLTGDASPKGISPAMLLYFL